MNRWRLSIYIFTVALAVFMVGARNYLVGGIFCLDDPRDLGQITCFSAECIARNMRMILFAAPAGEYSIAAVTIVFGTFIGLLALVFRTGWLSLYPIGLGVAILGVFPPYFTFEPFGYTPRFSAHLLPLAALSLALSARLFLLGFSKGEGTR